MKTNKQLLFSLILMMLIAALTGLSSVKYAQAEPPPDKNTVLIQDYSFQPDETTILKGETVTWINQDSVGHTIRGKTFNSGLLRNGQSFKQTFNEAGIFDYYCSLHPEMKGKVIVQ